MPPVIQALAPVTAPLASPDPEPSPRSSTEEFFDDVAEVPALVVNTDDCATTDTTACGLLNRLIGNQDVAEVLSRYAGQLLLVVVVLISAVLLRYLAHRAIRRTVARIEAEDPTRRGRLDLFEPADPITRERKVQRAKAIGSILKATVSIVVWTAALFVVLGTIGVNITGLVAGAGIVGIAVGFGAQTLVQDFVSGLFMIAEDQYGVGDVIDMGEASGVVEAVGLRTTRLRAVDGTVWHVRNGEVVRVGNMSQGWSRVVLDIGVGYGADVGRVMELLGRLGTELQQDAAFGAKILEPPEVWGVEALAVDQVTIRMIIKTAPLEQWVVAREMRRRIKHGFDTLGIEGPLAQRPMWVHTTGPGARDEQPEPSDAPDPSDPPGPTPPPPVDTTRGEADVAHADAPDPGTGEPFRGAPPPERRDRT